MEKVTSKEYKSKDAITLILNSKETSKNFSQESTQVNQLTNLSGKKHIMKDEEEEYFNTHIGSKKQKTEAKIPEIPTNEENDISLDSIEIPDIN